LNTAIEDDERIRAVNGSSPLWSQSKSQHNMETRGDRWFTEANNSLPLVIQLQESLKDDG